MKKIILFLILLIGFGCSDEKKLQDSWVVRDLDCEFLLYQDAIFSFTEDELVIFASGTQRTDYFIKNDTVNLVLPFGNLPFCVIESLSHRRLELYMIDDDCRLYLCT